MTQKLVPHVHHVHQVTNHAADFHHTTIKLAFGVYTALGVI